MEYRVLGPLEVRADEAALPLGGKKQRALLALLVLNVNHVVSRERLIDELWGDNPPQTAVQSVQVYVSRLRKLLPPETLVTRPPGYLLAAAPETIDLHRFERLVTDARKADPERASGLLREALELWRGPALGEFGEEPFAQAEAGRLEDLRLAAVEERIEVDLSLGRHTDLVGELATLIAANPHRERLRSQLMLALYRASRQAEALVAYRETRAALDELGIEPSAELRELEKAILVQDAALAAPLQSALRGLPSGTVTLLFSDIEGSTRLLNELGARYAEVLAEYRLVLREVFAGHEGVEVDAQGDAFFYAFARASDAVAAARAGQRALGDGPVRAPTCCIRVSRS